MGARDNFTEGQEFLRDTGLTEIDMLWEFTGNIWDLNRVRTNSSLQLFSYDLLQGSQIFQFNVPGRQVVLDAAIQTPWAPPDSPNVNQ